MLQLHRDFGGERRAGRRAENTDVPRLVRLQQLFVHCDHIIDRCGKRILRCQPVVHRHNLDLRRIPGPDRLRSVNRNGINPPPCRLPIASFLFASGVSTGVMMSVRTPAVVVSSMFTGKTRFASADCFLRHSSVCARRSSSVCAAVLFLVSPVRYCWASGLMVVGIGTMRVTCAVPSGSNVAESTGAVSAGAVALHPQIAKQIAANAITANFLSMIRSPHGGMAGKR